MISSRSSGVAHVSAGLHEPGALAGAERPVAGGGELQREDGPAQAHRRGPGAGGAHPGRLCAQTHPHGHPGPLRRAGEGERL